MEKRTQGNVLEAVHRGLEQGLLPSSIYSDPEIFELEIERVFGRAWLYVGHESEIPKPGDYVVRNLAGDSFIMIRADDGQIRVLLNQCRHRGNLVCRTERGNASSFQCAYHGWVYDKTGDLLAVPVPHTYEGPLDGREWGLRPAPRVDQYNGLVFASLSPTGPDLPDYLGEMRWYLDLFTKRTVGGHEVIGIPRRWTVNANWKYPADNFSADGLHAAFVHGSLMEIGLVPGGAGSAGAWSVCLNNGHALWMNFAHPGVPLLSARSYPALMESIKRTLTSQQVEIYEKAPYHGGTVFPNLSYIDAAFPPASGGTSVNYTSLRVWQPVASDRIEILSWFLVEKEAPKEFKEASYKAYMSNFGPSGVFEQDDAEVWCGATQTAKGPMGRSLAQNISGGIHYQPDPSFPGPGDAVDNSFFEVSQRAFYRKWLEYMSTPTDSATASAG